jgi:DNA-binding response OmpR family regulator
MVAKKRILSVSYDEALLATRRMLLETAGFEVVPALGFTDALVQCEMDKFDLIIIGHTLPRSDKEALVANIKLRKCGPVLSLRKHEDQPVAGADWSVDSGEGPEMLLRTVKNILGQPGASRRVKKK